MRQHSRSGYSSVLLAAILTICLVACSGSGGGGVGVTSIPAPPAAAPAAPAPPTTPLGVQLGKIFAEPLHNNSLTVAGKAWQFDYVSNQTQSTNIRDAGPLSVTFDPVSATYQVSGPMLGSGTLYQIDQTYTSVDGTHYAGRVASTAAEAAQRQSGLRVQTANTQGTKYSYVSFVELYADEPLGSNSRTVAYGAFGVAQPTRAGDVPVTGSARYSGDVRGYLAGDSGATSLGGKASFDFDFASASLSGNMTVSLVCFMGCIYPDVVYSFAGTQFVRGATTFSGGLTTAGAPSNGSFSGQFAGPQAAELMAQFQLPYFSPETKQWMQGAGAILGKKE